MYDDNWYTALSSKSHAAQSSAEVQQHHRRHSLLKLPSGHDKADDGLSQGAADRLEEPSVLNRGPPQATVARRAKSYGDFYDVARAQLKKGRLLDKRKRRRSTTEIKNEVDFGKWYDGISEDLLGISIEEYRSYAQKLHLARSHLDFLLESTSTALDLLSSLSESFKTVEAQTSYFRSRCEGLASEQTRISRLAEDVSENYQFYALLEPITRRLNAPGAGNLVRRKEFPEMLSNLDRCLDYMQAHPDHRESAAYKSRYRLLLTRALTLIRVHFCNALRDIAADVSKRVADRQLNDTTMSALLYAKFRVGSSELKQLGMEIQKRAVHPDGTSPGTEPEYQSLMNELHQNYASIRGKLVLPIIRKRMNEIAMAPSTAKELVPFARSSISYIRGICYDEFDLWGEWFSGERGLYTFLEAIVEPLHDFLRPMIIRETQVLKLCELCSLIQTRYMEEEDEDDDADSVDTPKLDFGALIQPVLEDAQTRLVFLVLSIMRDDIEYYKPKPADLDIVTSNRRTPAQARTQGAQPALSGKRAPSDGPPTALPKEPVLVEEDNDGDHGWNYGWNYGSNPGMQKWYPTLRKAIWLLSRIYRLVNSTVFDDLAHQIVHQTTQSLHKAALQISTRASPTDAQLFLIKHLLILKQQIVAFDIEFVTPQVSFDFSSVTNTFWELRERGGLFNPRNLMRLVGGSLLPRVVDNMFDAKAELDGHLRTVINELTAGFARRMTAAVGDDAVAKKTFNANSAAHSVREAVSREVPFLRQKLEEYLDDPRTRETLVGAVQDQVVTSYEHFYERHVAANALVNGKGVSRKGKGREDDVWDPEAFSEWTEGVFNVAVVEMSAGDGDSSRSLSRSGSM